MNRLITLVFVALYFNPLPAQLTHHSFDYLALNEEELGMKNGLEYKYVLDTDNLNNKETLLTKSTNDESIIFIESNRTRRSLDDLMSNLRLLTSDTKQKSNVMAVSNEFCLFSNIKYKLDECFAKSDDCKVILDCIASFNLVELCKQQNMYTPTIWILNIYEILRNENFCSFPVECAIIPNENEYLRKLYSVLNTVNEYGPAYLNQPKVDNKKYCSKSHHLIERVREAFDIFDMCFEITEMNRIRDLIEESADLILDRNCHYCISANIFFDTCFTESYGTFNSVSCHDAFKCVQDRIETYQCNKEQDFTPLKLITAFMNNMTSLCKFSNDSSSLESVREWFLGVDLCLKERHHIGLTFYDVPPNFDYCAEIEDTYSCIKNNYKNMVEALPDLKASFDQFAREYNRLQRSCDVFSLSKLTTTAPNYFTRHPYVNNSEQTILEDNKNYYHETIIRAELDQSINWINVDSPQFALYEVKRDHDLSKNYLKATIVKLKFKFPYYGHLLDQIVVATGGFLYVGSLMNPLITKAQYIAPLMANFDPTLSNSSMIKYVDNTTHFVCTWENLKLQDQPENGEYSFQVVLKNDGQIMFNYKKIPTINISNSNHTVKIGLSDAYIFYRLLSKSKIEYTIVQYHVVSVTMENIKTGNSIILFMLPNCLQFKTCENCVSGLPNFKCIWCPALQRCSDTVDRYRQEWVEYTCPMDYSSQSNDTCLIEGKALFDANTNQDPNDLSNKETEYVKSVVFGIFITIVISMLLTTVTWVGYAYKNPNSASGIWLIEHRPRKVFSSLMNRFNRNTSSLTRLEDTVA